MAQLGDLEAYKIEVARILRESRSLNPMPGLTRADVPGSLEWQREQARTQSGIPLTEEHLDLLRRVARESNVPIPWGVMRSLCRFGGYNGIFLF